MSPRPVKRERRRHRYTWGRSFLSAGEKLSLHWDLEREWVGVGGLGGASWGECLMFALSFKDVLNSFKISVLSTQRKRGIME